jgi:hypothetical protein
MEGEGVVTVEHARLAEVTEPRELAATIDVCTVGVNVNSG